MEKVYIALTTQIEQHKHIIKETEYNHKIKQILGVFSDYDKAYDACKTDAEVIADYLNTEIVETVEHEQQPCVPVIKTSDSFYFIIPTELDTFTGFFVECFDFEDIDHFKKPQ